jgi:hypothetical protein
LHRTPVEYPEAARQQQPIAEHIATHVTNANHSKICGLRIDI